MDEVDHIPLSPCGEDNWGNGLSKKKRSPPERISLKRSLSEEDYVNYMICQVALIYPNIEGDENHINELIDCYRYLRNLLGNPETSSYSLKPLNEYATNLCEVVERYLHVDREKAESTLPLCRISLQFLGNAVSHEETASTYRSAIWRDGASARYIADLLEDQEDQKVRVYGSMVFYNCLRERSIFDCCVLWCTELMETIFRRAFRDPVDENPWALFAAQMLLADERFLESIWGKTDTRGRIHIGLIASVGLSEKAENESTSAAQIHDKNVSILASAFVNECEQLSELECRNDEREFELSAALLQFLCQATSFDGRFQNIRDDERILNAALTLLKMTVKELGTAREELDKMAAKLQEKECGSTEVKDWFVNGPPLIGYRSGLVRLLANMCYDHPKNQRLIREWEGIPLILGATPLDADNNFIKEWAVFAMRNLLVDCPENQEIVEGITRV